MAQGSTACWVWGTHVVCYGHDSLLYCCHLSAKAGGLVGHACPSQATLAWRSLSVVFLCPSLFMRTGSAL